ncbi:MAG: DUF885 domain-containing protein, partial [Chloroflexota bacterium]|nr:DUF885 domain-containing protein [Chloroflexota bacterium]
MSQPQSAALVQTYLSSLYEYSPEMAFSLGLLQYAGRVSDPSSGVRNARIAELQSLQRRMSEVSPGDLQSLERFDLELARSGLEYELYQLRDLREYEWNPMAYLSSVEISAYAKRSYAPLEQRARDMVAHLRAVPDYLATASGNLRPDLARPILELAIEATDGHLAYLRGEAQDTVSGVTDRALPGEFRDASAAAAAALEDFAAGLRERLPHANGEFAIGRECYEAMLRCGELVDLPLDRVLEVGEADLQRNQELLRETVQRIVPGGNVEETMRSLGREHPSADRLVPET